MSISEMVERLERISFTVAIIAMTTKVKSETCTKIVIPWLKYVGTDFFKQLLVTLYCHMPLIKPCERSRLCRLAHRTFPCWQVGCCPPHNNKCKADVIRTYNFVSRGCRQTPIPQLEGRFSRGKKVDVHINSL